jgi:hypothetical protein
VIRFSRSWRSTWTRRNSFALIVTVSSPTIPHSFY